MTNPKSVSCAIVCLATVLLGGCRGSQEASFKNLASEKETGLKRVFDKTTQHGKTACRNFQSSVQGDIGTIDFGAYIEVDGSSAGLGVIRVEIGWKAKYGYKNGKWDYVSSERQVWDGQLQPQGWSSGDTRREETDIEILRVLKS